MGLSEADVLIGIGKAVNIVRENEGSPLHAIFMNELSESAEKYRSLLAETRRCEIAWHREVGETQENLSEATNTFMKWRDLTAEQLPGADLVTWEKSDATPNEVEVALDRLYQTIDEHSEKLSFSEFALKELSESLAALSENLDQDTETARSYRDAVARKNEYRTHAETLFRRVRRFILREFGRDSVHYSQLRDRAVKASREKEMPSVTTEDSAESRG